LSVILIILVVILVSFSFVLIGGAPYLPTLKKQIAVALELADLKKGETIIELGCGDGRVLVAAAKKDLKVVGYELNPIMFLLCWFRTIPYRKQVKVIWGNFWVKHWPPAEAIYVFLLPRLMDRLDSKIQEENMLRAKVVSFAFKFPNRQPVLEKDGVFLYNLNIKGKS